VLTSLQTGVVDGFDNTPLFAFATSWYQAAHHLTLSQHSYQPGIAVYSSHLVHTAAGRHPAGADQPACSR
jgi:TRAP-type C4-dicarboxylate transport system substrate-binding protein